MDMLHVMTVFLPSVALVCAVLAFVPLRKLRNGLTYLRFRQSEGWSGS